MRRYAFIFVFVVLLVVPILLRWVMAGAATEHTASVASRLVILTANNQDIRKEFRWAFIQWHQQKYGQAVEVEYLNPGGTNDIQRQLETTYREIRKRNNGKLPPEDQVQSVGADLVWGGGDYFFNNVLKPAGILRPITIDARVLDAAFPQPRLAGVKLYDYNLDKAGQRLPPLWVGTCLSSFGIIYNPDVYQSIALPAPTTWADLTNEKLVGAVALADPTHSGSASVSYMMIVQRAMADAEADFFKAHEKDKKSQADLKKTPAYEQALSMGWNNGMRELVLIAANARYFSDSATQPPNDVASGDAAAGMAIDFYGRVTEQSVGRRRAVFITPRAATAITPDPIAILYGTTGKQLELANHFIEFVLSSQGQRLWILNPGQPDGPRERSLHRLPVRFDVYANRAGWADDVNYFQQAGNFNQRGEWMGQMTDLRPLWSAAWIDDREDLRRAYNAVLNIPDESRRKQLIFKLSDIPITMADVKLLGEQRKKIESDPHSDSDLWKAQSRIDWANKFREHYRQVGAEAAQSSHG